MMQGGRQKWKVMSAYLRAHVPPQAPIHQRVQRHALHAVVDAHPHAHLHHAQPKASQRLVKGVLQTFHAGRQERMIICGHLGD